MSRKFACLYLAVALLVSSIWIASADERDTVQQEVQYSAAVEALDAAGLTSRSSNVLPSGEGLALALELGLPEEETISLSQLPTEALKTSQAQEDAARRKQADTAAAAADAAAKEAARQSLLSEYDGVQLTEAVRLRSAADNDTAPSLTIDSGKVARLNDYQDGWYQVTFGQSTGYIPAEYAQPVHYADYEGTSATNTVRRSSSPTPTPIWERPMSTAAPAIPVLTAPASPWLCSPSSATPCPTGPATSITPPHLSPPRSGRPVIWCFSIPSAASATWASIWVAVSSSTPAPPAV